MYSQLPVIFLCSRLDLPGGTERAIANTANLLDSRGHPVIILVLDETEACFYPLSPGVRKELLPLHFGLTSKGNPITRKLAFRNHIKQLQAFFRKESPGIIIGTDYVFSIAARLAANKTEAKIYAWEHHHFHWLKKSRFWNYLYRKIYPRLDAVICLNKTEAGLFQKMGCRTIVIPNFVSVQKKALLEQKKILSVGWLIKRKGADLVPLIAERLFKENPDWQWIIIGSGNEKDDLQRSIDEKGLSRHVKIAEPVDPVLDEVYLDSSIYVMTSRFECFPMVLLEAMSFGIPCISFDCPTGPADIIRDRIDGYLPPAENIEAISEAIINLMNNEEERKRMGENAYRNVDRFSPENIYPLWQSVTGETMAQSESGSSWPG